MRFLPLFLFLTSLSVEFSAEASEFCRNFPKRAWQQVWTCEFEMAHPQTVHGNCVTVASSSTVTLNLFRNRKQSARFGANIPREFRSEFFPFANGGCVDAVRTHFGCESFTRLSRSSTSDKSTYSRLAGRQLLVAIERVSRTTAAAALYDDFSGQTITGRCSK